MNAAFTRPEPSVLIAAFSGRGLAAAARRAGYVPLVADLFADADTQELAARSREVPGTLADGFRDEALFAALEELAEEHAPAGLVYGAGFEARPDLLAELGRRWPILGNSPEVIARLKNPEAFAAACAKLGIPHPEITRQMPARPAEWLRKRSGGAGGTHVRGADEGTAPDAVDGTGTPHTGDGHYFQRAVAGRSISVLFVTAPRGSTRVIGFSEQWRAPSAAEPFRFGGALRPARIAPQVEAALAGAVSLTAREFGLTGINSADFIVGDGGAWWLLEINPRPGATLDIFDSAECPLFALHMAAVSSADTPPVPKLNGVATMRILYTLNAKYSLPSWVYPAWIADRPRSGTSLAAGAPFCTVLANGESACEAENLCAERFRLWQAVLEEQA